MSLYNARYDEQSATAQFIFPRDSVHLGSRLILSFLQTTLGLANSPAMNIILPEPAYYQAKYFFWQGDTAAALQCMEKLSIDSADRLEVESSLALQDDKLQELSLGERRQHLASITARLDHYLSADTSHAQLNLLAARSFIWQEKFDLAAEYLKRVLQTAPWRSELYVMMSHLHYSRYQKLGFANEIELLRKALYFNPGNLGIVQQLAASYLQIDKPDKAQELLEVYLEREPDNFMLLKALGQTYIKRGQRHKIFEIYKKILEIEPDNTEAFYNLGIFYFHSGEMQAAKGFFKKALRIDPQIDSYLYLAHIAEKEDDADIAIHYLQKRLEFATQDNDEYTEEARQRLLDLMLAKGRIDSNGQVIDDGGNGE
ncbi:MAG: tetratricopeptide repeat protein [Calditrichaeota bacterium]|nr:MAG: tetratricopeptide repeat protein [Calditrichota bacterium]